LLTRHSNCYDIIWSTQLYPNSEPGEQLKERTKALRAFVPFSKAKSPTPRATTESDSDLSEATLEAIDEFLNDPTEEDIQWNSEPAYTSTEEENCSSSESETEATVRASGGETSRITREDRPKRG